jgi:hypothetical protein
MSSVTVIYSAQNVVLLNMGQSCKSFCNFLKYDFNIYTSLVNALRFLKLKGYCDIFLSKIHFFSLGEMNETLSQFLRNSWVSNRFLNNVKEATHPTLAS